MSISHYTDLIQSALAGALDPSSPYVIFDFPNHSNVGDSAIWLGEVIALTDFFGRPPLSSFSLLPGDTPFPALRPSVQIILHGGGNLGDLWPRFQMFRERIISHYTNHRIVQLPQSIHFNDEQKLRQCEDIFSRHRNLILFVRDEASLAIGSQLHRGRTQLVPDMALAMGSLERPCEPKASIVALLRSDKESVLTTDTTYLRKIQVVDWISEPWCKKKMALLWLDRLERKLPVIRNYPSPLREYCHGNLARDRVKRGCGLLSQGQVVITDRLHAHILCFLMGIPHVILDNSYGKISRFRRAWGTGDPVTCLEATSLEDAQEKANYLLGLEKISSP